MPPTDDAAKIKTRYGGTPLNRGNLLGRCPEHHYEGAIIPETFTYKTSDDGSKLFLKCWAGCSLDEIVDALVFDGVCDQSIRQYTFLSKDHFPLEFDHPWVGNFAAEFDSMNYSPTDIHLYKRDGKLEQFKVDYKPKTAKFFVHVDGFNKCVHALKPMMYRHDEIVSALNGPDELAHLFLHEHDADEANRIGIEGAGMLTCSSGALPQVDLNRFKNKNACLWIGDDQKALKKIQQTLLILHRMGCSVWLLVCPFGRTFGDWTYGGGTLADAVEIINKTPQWLPEAEQLDALSGSGELPLSEYDLGSDAYAGELYAKEYRHLVRYNTTLKVWMHFNGKHWKEDQGGDHQELAKKLSKKVKMAMAKVSPDLAKPLEKLAATLQSDSGRKSVISSARTVPLVKIEHQMFDGASTKNLVSCDSGVIHLLSGAIKPHSYEYLIARHIPLECNMEDEPTEFLEFMKQLWKNEEVAEYMLNFMGMCLTGQTDWQHFLYWKGSPGSGKSQLTTILRHVFGPFCGAIDAGSLTSTQQRSASVDSDLAGAAGTRMLIAYELSPEYNLDERLINAMTGGDVLRVKFMHGDKFDMKPECKLVFSSNYDLKFTAPAGIARRVIQVKFTRNFWQEKGRKLGIGQAIAEKEGPQILGHLVKRAQKYLLNPDCMREPRTIRDWSNDYVAILNYADQKVVSM